MNRDLRTRWPDVDADDEAAMELLRGWIAGVGVCPPSPLLQALGAGVLPPTVRDRVARHVTQCHACQALATALEDDSLNQLSGDEEARIRQRVESTMAHIDSTKKRATWRWAAAAGLFVATTGAVSAALWWTKPEASDTRATSAREMKASGRLPLKSQSESQTMRLTGIVTGTDGEPLAGVTVGEHVGSFGHNPSEYPMTYSTPFKATTDASGRYTIVGVPVSRGRTTAVRAAKVGHFTETAQVVISPEMQVDFRLDAWVHIRLGETIAGTVTTNDKGDSVERFDEFALTVTGTGTLEVSAEPTNRERMDLYVETPTGEVYGLRIGAPMQLALPAMAAATYQIRVLSFTTDPRPYKLTTRLK